jgi:hypothetical protein
LLGAICGLLALVAANAVLASAGAPVVAVSLSARATTDLRLVKQPVLRFRVSCPLTCRIQWARLGPARAEPSGGEVLDLGAAASPRGVHLDLSRVSRSGDQVTYSYYGHQRGTRSEHQGIRGPIQRRRVTGGAVARRLGLPLTVDQRLPASFRRYSVRTSGAYVVLKDITEETRAREEQWDKALRADARYARLVPQGRGFPQERTLTTSDWLAVVLSDADLEQVVRPLGLGRKRSPQAVAYIPFTVAVRRSHASTTALRVFIPLRRAL